MSLQSRLTGASLMLGLLVTFSLPALAQEQSSTTQEGAAGTQQQQTERRGKRWHRGKRGMHGMRGMMHMLRELNLTEAQQQQARAIFDRYEASTKPQREEMRQLFQQKRAQGNAEPDAQTQARAEALRAQFKESARLMQDELLTILTPEQRTKLEQMKQERKARHEERRARRQGQMNDNQ